ncbi:MAG: sugar ABC transporter substrate-binding protein [Tepidanaerobacteraceae bacterium]|nr:sugar ABC transporter substrate-binding protein [Tepidanaerobacteraceae bacterium]
MKRLRLLLACILVVCMVASLIVGCSSGSKQATEQNKNEATSEGATSKSESTSQEAGKTENPTGVAALEALLSMKDNLSLSGIQPLKLNSRANIFKAVPVKQKKDVTIGWCAASLGSTFFENMIGSARDTAKKYGYKLLYENANFNVQTQSTHMETFITKKVDVIVLNAVHINSSLQDIKHAVEAGIPVIVTGPTPTPEDFPVITTILSGSYAPGFQVGEYIAQKFYQKGKVLKVGVVAAQIGMAADSESRPCGFIGGFLHKSAEIAGNPYPSKYDAMYEGYKAWIEFRDKGKLDLSEKGINLVGYGNGGSPDPQGGQKGATDLLTAHPDMDILFVETDPMFPGVEAEIKSHNMVPGKDIVVACAADGLKAAMDAIKQGRLLVTGYNSPLVNGTTIVELIHDMFEEGRDVNNLVANAYTPAQIITPENVDQFYDPNLDVAKPIPFEVPTIDEYNAAHANEK